MDTVNCQGKTNLKILRDKLQISQFQMAQRLGVSRSAIAQYESGAREFRLDLKQVRELLIMLHMANLTIDDIYK